MKKWFVILAALALLVVSIVPAMAQDSITVWTKYNSESPQNIQDEWMAALIDSYNAETGVTLNHITRPFDTLNTDLNLALLAGGDVPDVSYVDGAELTQFSVNGTLTDLTEFVTGAAWFEDLSPAALAACTSAEGAILCVPSTLAGTLSYYWTDAFPDGFDGSIEQLATYSGTEYALTGKSTEAFGFNVFIYPLLTSFGAVVADAEGNATWASAETVAAIDYLRNLHAEGLIPETSLASGFEFENSFKDGTAAAFAAGSWSFVYLNPLTAPDGTTFPADSTAVETALSAGELGFAPPLHTAAGSPASVTLVNGWAVPIDAPNPEAALAFIDWQMTTQRNAEYAASYGALPALLSSLETESFGTPYWQGLAEILNAYGTPPPPFFLYAPAANKFMSTLVDLIQNPDNDILAELQTAQDEYNAEVAAAR